MRYARTSLLCSLICLALGAFASAATAKSAPVHRAARKHHTAAPVRKSAPKVTGVPALGKVLKASPGRWSGKPKFTYQWLRCNKRGAKCKLIKRPKPKRGRRRQPANRYTVVKADLGHKIRIRVLARNSHGRASATSRPTAVIQRKPPKKASPKPSPAPAPAPAPAPTPAPSAAPGLHVVGNHLLKANGQSVVLHGVDRSGTEYMCSEGYGVTDGPSGSSEFSPMVSWGINSVFIGLNEDCWLGINGVKAAYGGQNYVSAIKAEVAAAEAAGLYPVIGFFWGDPGSEVSSSSDPNGGGQPALPDNDHAPLFWEEVADTFKGDPNVILRLQEEPHPANDASTLAAWQCWSKGDVQYSPGSVNAYGTAPTPSGSSAHCNETATNGSTHYSTVGMQSLVNIIRGAGADNVIQVPGVQYANMMACSTGGSPASCGFLDSADGVRVVDTLASPQLMADVDVYPDANPCGGSSTACYAATYAPVIAQMPFEAGETGPTEQSNPNMGDETTFLNWMDANGAGYYAWAWDTWTNLLSNYNGTPTSPWGTDYKARLAG